MTDFISKLQLHLIHSAEVVVGDQVSISLLNSKMGDFLEDHTTIWLAMGEIIDKLILHGVFMGKNYVDGIMKEAREAHLLTSSIKHLWEMIWPRQTQRVPRFDLC